MINPKGLEAAMLEQFATNRSLSLGFHEKVYGDDDDQPTHGNWVVWEETGNINDREWLVRGFGPTPVEALTAAFRETYVDEYGATVIHDGRPIDDGGSEPATDASDTLSAAHPAGDGLEVVAWSWRSNGVTYHTENPPVRTPAVAIEPLVTLSQANAALSAANARADAAEAKVRWMLEALEDLEEGSIRVSDFITLARAALTKEGGNGE